MPKIQVHLRPRRLAALHMGITGTFESQENGKRIGQAKHVVRRDCEGPRENAITSYVSSVDPGPSPTGSVGCEPHGDHWYVTRPQAPCGENG